MLSGGCDPRDAWQALDEQQAAVTSAKLAAEAAAAQGVGQAPESPHKLPSAAPSKEALEWVAIGSRPPMHEGFTRRHSCSDLPTSPRRAPAADTGKESAEDGSDGTSAIVRPKPLRPHVQSTASAACAVRAEVKENKVLGTEPPRSPTPHPRHGMFVDRDGQERLLIPVGDREGKQVRAVLAGASVLVAVCTEACACRRALTACVFLGPATDAAAAQGECESATGAASPAVGRRCEQKARHLRCALWQAPSSSFSDRRP
jgi:hypothetical protein